ncbi:sulfur reduction protein DsrE [Marinobacter panjinensis]|uniref:Sulfur reduction protein DsrE n=1 Tax=Marinobacter panjinensis TaxID=2576384 RepID=A0A4U6R469_9GAMM|nr:DsrE family protein [Marinobacter panjinensis]MCR8915937.1 DsrE family protein [Marinobacter panjinensis]TKV67096.1 sulfur reduction protein DsrE [Marinobacter panjinensis]
MSTLIIIDQPPYGSWEGREALDMAFSLAAFDQPVSLLFCGAGVNWLRKGQDAAKVHQKSIERNLSAAPIFGVEALLADSHACDQYGLVETELLDQATITDFGPELTARFDHVAFAG